jgi:hypothetical protein
MGCMHRSHHSHPRSWEAHNFEQPRSLETVIIIPIMCKPILITAGIMLIGLRAKLNKELTT